MINQEQKEGMDRLISPLPIVVKFMNQKTPFLMQKFDENFFMNCHVFGVPNTFSILRNLQNSRSSTPVDLMIFLFFLLSAYAWQEVP